MFDLAKLQTFLQDAESPSFSEAARRLHLSRPTFSRHIQRLESELGIELFIRYGHDHKLTEAGPLLLPLASKLIREAVEIQQLTSSFQDQIVGHIRIACSESIVNTVEAGFGVSFVSRLAAAGALERRAVIEV